MAFDKIGVTKSGFNKEEFIKYDVKETRVNCTHKVLDFLKENGLISVSNIFLLGYSEGGDVASQVSAERKDLQGLILMACGGYSALQEMELYSKKHPGLKGKVVSKTFKKKCKKILANPTVRKKWLGHTYKRWASYLNEAPIDYLKKTKIPILSIHGSSDKNCPIESSYYLRDEFSKLKRDNYTLMEFQNCDHDFKDKKGEDRIYDAIIKMFEWIKTCEV